MCSPRLHRCARHARHARRVKVDQRRRRHLRKVIHAVSAHHVSATAETKFAQIMPRDLAQPLLPLHIGAMCESAHHGAEIDAESAGEIDQRGSLSSSTSCAATCALYSA